MLLGLLGKSRPILALQSFAALLFGSGWHPLKGEFGFLPFLVRDALGDAGGHGHRRPGLAPDGDLSLRIRARAASASSPSPSIDLLAGIPSVVYGVWGVLDGRALRRATSSPRCSARTPPAIRVLVGRDRAGHHGLSDDHPRLPRGLRLGPPGPARHVARPRARRRWETVKHVVLRKGLQGIIAAVVLGLSRAFGETMAVLMVVGNVARVAEIDLRPGAYPLPALIANNYGEMMSIPLYDSALMLAALVLFARRPRLQRRAPGSSWSGSNGRSE